jgi:hypothetical protein
MRGTLTAVLLGFLVTGCGGGGEPQAPVVILSGDGSSEQGEVTNSKDFGDYVLHFNALTTDGITPEVARQYGITRSSNRALLNVSIVKKQDGGAGLPVAGSVTARAVNLTGQVKNLELRQIVDGDAVYYIGEVPVANRETLIFDISATPINESSRFDARFQQQFYTE